MKKIVTILGARPQFIKSCFVSKSLKKFGIKEYIIHSGQHYDYEMSKVFFEEFSLKKPDFFLDINQCSQNEMIAKIIINTQKILKIIKPKIVLVYGDTNTTVGGAIAASNLGIDVCHIEAGMRSFDQSLPEERNRLITDRLSKYMIVPNNTSYKNLLREGYTKYNIYKFGDPMLELLLSIKDKTIQKNKFDIFITIHRKENIENKKNLKRIINLVNYLSNKYKILFPIHPSTRNFIKKFDLKFAKKNNLILSKPINYFSTIDAIKNTELVITDSGGVQREAFYLNKKQIVLRKNSEWREFFKFSGNSLVDLSKYKDAVLIKFIKKNMKLKKKPNKIDIFFPTKCSEKIAKLLKKSL